MKTIALTALAAAAAVATVAAPAAAQPYGRDHHRYEADRYGADRGDYNLNKRQNHLQNSIERGVRLGSLTRWEARRLQAEFNEVARLEARYRYNGLSNWERSDLDRRFDRLERQIQLARSDTDRRNYSRR
ncbi:MAG: hypothetical protein JNK30_09875 [Phenylobacterium sp.]|uniref:hypothetical protein n=1 Tax=Phenylobacterium sp. TaxID=1871053 RepID=UPI001A5E7470|nr:hypothetical protein [Phenylobacterium sp.]MBL8771677.1 hypothetical protein [Phenylobacterium sp.]